MWRNLLSNSPILESLPETKKEKSGLSAFMRGSYRGKEEGGRDGSCEHAGRRITAW